MLLNQNILASSVKRNFEKYGKFRNFEKNRKILKFRIKRKGIFKIAENFEFNIFKNGNFENSEKLPKNKQ